MGCAVFVLGTRIRERERKAKDYRRGSRGAAENAEKRSSTGYEETSAGGLNCFDSVEECDKVPADNW